ncbi:MAG TPA: ferritin family protein [Burkholderiales bacterium]|nr:ferritin family protein [Burkholderiales bacterium]
MSAKKAPAKAGAAPKGKARPPQLRVVKAARPSAAAVRTMNELMAYAYALELEASERYAEFAEAMAAHNNREVAELFRKLARIEHRHAEQVLEDMGWAEPPAPPSAGYRWEGPEGPETADVTALHYLMQPYHVLELALHNERRAHRFFTALAKAATTDRIRRAALGMAAEEAEHVRLIEDWMKRVPPPEPHWDLDPDPPRYAD